MDLIGFVCGGGMARSNESSRCSLADIFVLCSGLLITVEVSKGIGFAGSKFSEESY